MRILDRYILRHYLINFLILSFALLGLMVLVDLIFDFDEFVKAGQLLAGRYGGRLPATLWVIIDYYYPLLLLFYVYVAGLLVTAAAGFTVSSMVGSGEVGAVVSSGTSMFRLAAPLLAAGVMLVLLAVPIQELIIPRFANKLARGKSQVAMQSVNKFSVHFAHDAPNRLFVSAAEFDPTHNRLDRPTFLQLDEHHQVLRRIEAEEAFWDADAEAWILKPEGIVRRMNRAAAFPGETQEVVDTVPTVVTPNLLLARRAAFFPRFLSTAEIIRMAAADPGESPRLHTIMNARFSMLVMNVLCMCVALPYFLQREPCNMLIQGLKAMVTGLAVWGGTILLVQIGAAVFNPVTAAWLPVVVCLPIVVFLLQRIKT